MGEEIWKAIFLNWLNLELNFELLFNRFMGKEGASYISHFKKKLSTVDLPFSKYTDKVR